MSTPTPSHKAAVAIERDVADGYAASGNAWQSGTSSETVLDGVQSSSISTDGQSTEISELNEDGVRRLLGRSDATVDLELNFDYSATDHQNLLQDDQDDTIQYLFVIDFDNTTTSFAMAFVAKVATADIDLSDGAQTMSVTLENADGNKFGTQTGYQA